MTFESNIEKVKTTRLSLWGNAAAGMRASMVMSNSEVKGIRQALGEIEKTQESLKMEGLSQLSFTLGVLNLIFLVFVFAKAPQHIWVVYGLEAVVLIPAWWVQMIKEYNGHFFIVDFCWITNVLGTTYMLLSIPGLIPASFQLFAFQFFYACALGPLSWAAMILHNGMVFHSIEKITSLFIHYLPCVVVYAIVHHSDRVQESWPGRFPTKAEFEETTMLSMYKYGTIFYFTWLFFHGAWLLTIGVDFPKRGWATVFDNLYGRMDLGPKFTKLTGFTTIRGHAATYLGLHCFGCQLSFLWPAWCLRLKALHVFWLVAVLTSSVWSGAGYYDFVFAKKYTMVLQELLEEKESPKANKKDK